MKRLAGTALFLASVLFMAACQKQAPISLVSTSMNVKQKPEVAVANIAKIAQKCWFQSGDKAFKAFRLANEVSSFAGQPRFLLVPRKNPGGLPLLVVQAVAAGNTSSGKFTNVNAFGPLLKTAQGHRILSDVNRWSRGTSTCT